MTASRFGAGLSVDATVRLNADIRDLEGHMEGSTNREKALAFFRKPLWRGTPNPNEISQAIEPWRIRLLELNLLDLYNNYAPMLFSPVAINWHIAADEIRDWATQVNRESATGTPPNVPEKSATHSVDALVSSPTSGQRPSLAMLADVALQDDAADRLGFRQ